MYVCLSPPKHACMSETSEHVCMSEVTILILLSGALTRGSYINTTSEIGILILRSGA